MLTTAFEQDQRSWIQHQSVVSTVQATLLRSNRHQAEHRRVRRAPYNSPRDIPSLSRIVQIDEDTRIAWVEPNVTMEALVRATIAYGLVPTVVPSQRTMSVADAFAMTTTASSSFEFGAFDCSVLSLECILSNGQCVMAHADDPATCDLLFGCAGALIASR